MSGTFVSVGNAKQRFSRMLEIIAQISDRLPKPIVVQHGHTPFMRAGFNAIAFMDMDRFTAAVADAEVLIMHAGAGSVINAVRAGKIPIVVPRRAALGEHIDDHQMEFAQVLNESGKIVLAETAEQIIDEIEKAKNTGRVAAASVQSAMVNLVKDELNKLAVKYN